MKYTTTNRGFGVIEFEDEYNVSCSIQESSLAFKHCIWFGVEEAEPKILASQTPEGGTGWVPFHVPEEVLITTRMHLTQEQVAKLLPILTYFAQTGNFPEGIEDESVLSES